MWGLNLEKWTFEKEYVWVAYLMREETALLQSVRKRLWASVEGAEAGRINHPEVLSLCDAQKSKEEVSSFAQVVRVGSLSSFAAVELLSKGGLR